MVRAEKNQTIKHLKIFGPKHIKKNIKMLVDKTEPYDGYFESEFSKSLKLDIVEFRVEETISISKSATVKFY